MTSLNVPAPVYIGNNLKVREYPQLVKYMGSKAKIIQFVGQSIESVYDGGVVCDLFGGACSLSGALGGIYPVHSNDIQSYSELLASVYLKPLGDMDLDSLLSDAEKIHKKVKSSLPDGLDYSGFKTIEEFNEIDKNNRTLIDKDFNTKYHLFVKNYSGTWWSSEQCIWIDALKQSIDKRVKRSEWGVPEYKFAMSILMHAMAYSSQGTGHYAQYRDAKTESSMKDINIYRQKDFIKLYRNKFNQVKAWIDSNVVDLGHRTTSLDYVDCLNNIQGGTVYADPPYAFVHYSRFYHAMETLSLYDYPELQVKGGELVKGRYREGRHQSPFCIKSQVNGAFEKLFDGVLNAGSNLALSYSNTAMIPLETLLELSKKSLGNHYEIWVEEKAHRHMTMGRKDDRHRDISEIMLLARKK